MGFVSLKHCEKPRKLWKHTGKQTLGFSLLWLLWKRPEGLGQEWPGFHWVWLMGRCATSLFYSSRCFLRIKCHRAAHTRWQKNTKYAIIIGDCQNPIRPLQWVRSFIPTFPGHRDDDNCYCGPYLRGTKVTPQVTLLWGYIWWITHEYSWSVNI